MSTHSWKQAIQSAKEDVDYISVGPVFKTPLKSYLKPVGLELVYRVAKEVKRPVVAIGGIKVQNVQKVLKAGATTVAVISAVLKAKNTKKACRDMIEKMAFSKD